MAEEREKKSESSPKTTRNGNKLFEGAKDGKPFKKGVPKTEEEKKAISQGMHDAKKRRERDALIFGKASLELLKRIEDGTINTKDLNDAINNAADRLGDKITKQEISGSIGMQKVFVTPEMIDEAKEKTKELLEDG